MTTGRVHHLDNWNYARVLPGELPDKFLAIGQSRGVGRLLGDHGHDLFEDRVATAIDLDAFDHVYRARVAARQIGEATAATLRLPAVATIATVSWNGTTIATSSNSYLPLSLDITDLIGGGGDLEVRCHSLRHFLDDTKWPRPRFKTKLVTDQRLRHVRASLLGRIPSWSPPVPFIGIAGPVTIEFSDSIHLRTTTMRPTLHGGTATLQVHVELDELGPDTIVGATVRCGGESSDVTIETAEAVETSADEHERRGDHRATRRRTIRGVLRMHNVIPWWPHTHGEPTTYDVRVDLRTSAGNIVTLNLPPTGFRTIEVDRDKDGDGFGLLVNGISVFCRGSAWMPIDQSDPWVDRSDLQLALEQCRDAGMNMVRLTGVTGWEQPAFYELCDALGILVWQDLPFATLDQPTDAAFVEGLRTEIATHLHRLEASPSVVVICGGSERQQQAAMLGLDQTVVVDAIGARLVDEYAASTPLGAIVVGCSPSGGHLPFSADSGVAHYYGVGAYQRPLTDARHANVRFTTECLAFANVPESQTIDRFLLDGETPPTHPRWKARVPRDRGVGWDFDDVRDYYVHIVTGVDPYELRRRDLDRYLELSRYAAGIAMATTMHEWRRSSSSCKGAITWFLRDLWRGAGWGLIDSDGEPKAVLHALIQAWSPVSVALIDEGVNGVDIWVHNDRPTTFAGQLKLSRTASARPVGLAATTDVMVPAHGSLRLRADELYGRFTDPSDAYLFGPANHDAIAVQLRSRDGEGVSRYVLDTNGGASLQRADVEMTTTSHWLGDDTLAVDVTSGGLARGVRLEPCGIRASANHVDIVPNECRRFVLSRRDNRTWPSSVHFAAVNARSSVRVPIPPRPEDHG